MQQNSPNQAGMSYSDKDISSADSSTTDLPTNSEDSAQAFLDDPRFQDPHLKKFFFRQRVTSKSRHPSQHYQYAHPITGSVRPNICVFSCPLLPKNPTVCAKYGCSGVSLKRRVVPRKAGSLSASEKPPLYTEVTTEGTEADVEDICENSSSDCSAPVQSDGFEGFDFFQPRSPARMNSHSSSGSSSANNRTLVDRSADEADVDAFRGGRSVTLTAANASAMLSARDTAKTQRSHSERSVREQVSNDFGDTALHWYF